MKILMLAQHKWPHIGGVERHVLEISKRLKVKGESITIISEEDIKYPHIKFLGLLYIWFWLFKKRSLIEQSDIIHCHDVFIWYFPFRFLYPNKLVYTTFHGWEGIYPIPWKYIFLKKLTARLSRGNICVGIFIEKHYGIKADFITYGAVKVAKKIGPKIKNSYVFVGRLEKDTGLPVFLKFLSKRKELKVDFCGDGLLRKECAKYGKVHGFVDPKPFLKKASACFASGYLSALEAFVFRCKLMVGWNNPLKKDYWKLSPFAEWINSDNLNKAFEWAKLQTWENLTNQYLKLWKL